MQRQLWETKTKDFILFFTYLPVREIKRIIWSYTVYPFTENIKPTYVWAFCPESIQLTSTSKRFSLFYTYSNFNLVNNLLTIKLLNEVDNDPWISPKTLSLRTTRKSSTFTTNILPDIMTNEQSDYKNKANNEIDLNKTLKSQCCDVLT